MQLNNSISVGHILTAVVLVVSAIYHASKLEAKVDNITHKVDGHMARMIKETEKIASLELNVAVLKNDFYAVKAKCKKVEDKCYKLEKSILSEVK